MPVGQDAPVGRHKVATAKNIDADFGAATLHTEDGVALTILFGLPLRINAGEAQAAPGGPVAESHHHMKQAEAGDVGPDNGLCYSALVLQAAKVGIRLVKLPA